MDQAASRVAIPLVLLSAAISSVLSAVVALSVAAPTEPPTSAVRDPVDLSPVVDRLDALEQLMHEQARMTPGAVATRELVRVEEPTGVAEPIESTLRQLARQLGGPVAAQEVPREVPINWNELQRFCVLAEASYQSARESVCLMTAPEIVRRFGFPSTVETQGNGAIFLQYLHLGPNGEPTGGGAYFLLHQGYVTSFDSDPW